MDRQNRIRIMELLWPLFAGLGLILKASHKVFFAWWLDRLIQRKANRALLDDLEANLHFLCTKGQPVKEKQTRILPFDYASVYVIFGNVRFCFTRGRGELNVSLSPLHELGDSYELCTVVAALDSRDATEITELGDLGNISRFLGTRLDDLNDVFSEIRYPEFKNKLLMVEKSARMHTREVEWELNRRLYR